MSRRRDHARRTVGQAILCYALRSRSRRELALKIRRSEAAISRWASGRSLPDAPSRVALEREIEILEAHLFDEPILLGGKGDEDIIVKIMASKRITIQLDPELAARVEARRAPGVTIAKTLVRLLAQALESDAT